MTDSSTSTVWTGKPADPSDTLVQLSGVRAIEPPVPPSVNEGRMMTG